MQDASRIPDASCFGDGPGAVRRTNRQTIGRSAPNESPCNRTEPNRRKKEFRLRRNDSPRIAIFNRQLKRHGQNQKGIFLQGVRIRGSEMARALPVVRSMELLHGGSDRPRERLARNRSDRQQAPVETPARPGNRAKRAKAVRPLLHRGEPGARRGTDPGLDDPAGRRAGHRPIDVELADRAARKRPENAVRFGRGIAPANQDAGGAARRRQRRVLHIQRDEHGEHPAPDRRAGSRPGCHRLDPDDLYRHDRLVAGQRLADPRMRRPVAEIRQADRHVGRRDRPYHQGRRDRRAEDSGAHRGRRAPVRRRQQQCVPPAAQHQEPLRRDVRDRRIRNAGRRAGRGE